MCSKSQSKPELWFGTARWRGRLAGLPAVVQREDPLHITLHVLILTYAERCPKPRPRDRSVREALCCTRRGGFVRLSTSQRHRRSSAGAEFRVGDASTVHLTHASDASSTTVLLSLLLLTSSEQLDGIMHQRLASVTLQNVLILGSARVFFRPYSRDSTSGYCKAWGSQLKSIPAIRSPFEGMPAFAVDRSQVECLCEAV